MIENIVGDTRKCFELFSYYNEITNIGINVGNKDIIIDNSSLEGRYMYSKCSKCQESFVWGDKIHTHKSRQFSKIYHKRCWESLYH